MPHDQQLNLLSEATDLDLIQILLADLHDDLFGKVARSRQIADLSMSLGSRGTMIPGGEAAHAAYVEARSSFINGNYVATVLLCQALAEQVLASHLSFGLNADPLPNRIDFKTTIARCLKKGVINQSQYVRLTRLMELRNPLTHFRAVSEPSNIDRRAIDSGLPAQMHLLADASFAIATAIQILSLAAFRLER